MSEQGFVYAAFIEGELRAERERRSTLDSRGMGVVTSSGSLVALLVAVGVLVNDGKAPLVLPPAAKPMLGLALIAFSTAAALGILANRNRYYDVAVTQTLYDMIGDHWIDDEVDARNNVAELNIRTIHTLREGNNRKASLLTAALSAQLVALIGLSLAISIVFATR